LLVTRTPVSGEKGFTDRKRGYTGEEVTGKKGGTISRKKISLGKEGRGRKNSL